ncbi:MAG: carboxypeptidase regulatory-like domain-containing protein, partial [Terriglobia bacterium]
MGNNLPRSAAVPAAWAGKAPALRFFCAIACLVTFGLAAVAPSFAFQKLGGSLDKSKLQTTEFEKSKLGATYHGQVTFNGLPVPGATVTATQGSKKLATITDQQGLFSFPDLTGGIWTIDVEMTGFSTIKQDVVVTPNAPAAKWELKLLPLAEIKAEMERPSPTASRSPLSPLAGRGIGGEGADEAETSHPARSARHPLPEGEGAVSESTGETSESRLGELAAPGLLINGSQNNGATSPFAQMPAFGNNRNGGNGLYRFGIGAILDNSALDAAPYSLSGQRTPKPVYNRITGIATFGGPLRIPHLLQNGPTVFLGYEWTRNLIDITQSALVPDAAEREGDFSQVLSALGQPAQIVNPATGMPFSGNAIPPGQISPQARALLNFYPLPNFSGNARYNYQVPINSDTHQDALQARFDQSLGAKDQLYGGFAFQRSSTASPNLFGFRDTTDLLGLNTSLNWSHRLSQQLFLNFGYQFSRLATRVTPYFENRANVSGQAGISDNNQDPMNWGPPSLNFASGIAGLSDANASFNRNQTSAWSTSLLWNHGLHDITFGGDFRRQEFNVLSQQNPRGAFTFTGVATQGSASGAGGSDFADFLLGIPDTSSIAFGNADKYFRESAYDAYIDDDYRIRPGFTLNAGIRWEYGAPITELYNRLVNLDIAPGFAAVEPVVANSSSQPVGPLTGQRYPDSLIRPDKSAFEPRVGIAWRPIAGSSMVVRAGYGVYYDTSVYQTVALEMAQQAPLSKSLSVQNSAACPLTLANGFNNCPSITPDTFAIDPNFRVGYAQSWQLSI